MENVLKPRSLFPEDEDIPHGRRRLGADTDETELESLTSTDSEDAVFPNENPTRKKKLIRKNAMRRRPGRSVITCPRNTCNLDEALELAAGEDSNIHELDADDPRSNNTGDEGDGMVAQVVDGEIVVDTEHEVTPRRSARLKYALDYYSLNEAGERKYKGTSGGEEKR